MVRFFYQTALGSGQTISSALLMDPDDPERPYETMVFRPQSWLEYRDLTRHHATRGEALVYHDRLVAALA
jgi:hypothetical protein